MSIRSLPDEEPPPRGSGGDERRVALGVWDGDTLPSVSVGAAVAPEVTLDLAPMDLGADSGDGSWSEMALGLRDRSDLGPFRLAYLEAVLRMADWRVSASYDQELTR